MTIEAPAAPVAPLMKELIPQELHDREYLKPWLEKSSDKETMAEVFKKLDGAQTLIGKKSGIPAADAQPEEWNKFLASLAPGKADDYEIPVEKDDKLTDTFAKAIRESMLKGNINPRQAKGFLADFLPRLKADAAARATEQQKAQQKADLEFETLVKACFADDNAKVLSRVQKAINEFAPAPVKGQIARLDNNALAILTGVVDGIMRKYVPEAQLNPKEGAGNEEGAGKSARERAKILMQTKAYTNFQDPEHDKTVAEVKRLYQEASAAGEK